MVESRFANKQEDITVNKEGPSQIQEETDRKKRVLKENLRQLYFPGKRIFNTSLFIVGLAFIANAVLLYVDTLTTILHADIFFGFSKQGRNDHLQRSSAVLGFVVGFLNLYCASIEKNKALTTYTLFADGFSILHYLAETFYFKSIRYEYTALVTVFLLFNFIWAVRNYYYELRLVQEKKINQQRGRETQQEDIYVHED
ncbi:hypothetical protein FDP41_006704 [Naegleria fowleri]|uniref:Uncharacterized protein n=1 Tax=Naegleria fowleri TaxID=5763 RepID=A0A6A5BJ81_NAEFO|nr:uncharacterized protein FDP41_006704 [Naegleria fowleri]KAF0974094.1 hypothetical protein FDP41_006704 [Naegleria fowleri]CAG4716545.1 unnamed protein product [Naegleria fowleri]